MGKKSIDSAIMSEQDWQNLRLQLKTLVDIYCEMNNDIIKIKDSLKALIKHLRKQERDCNPKPKKETKAKKQRPSKLA